MAALLLTFSTISPPLASAAAIPASPALLPIAAWNAFLATSSLSHCPASCSAFFLALLVQRIMLVLAIRALLATVTIASVMPALLM